MKEKVFIYGNVIDQPMERDTLAGARYRVETRDTDLVIEKTRGFRQICFNEEISKYDYEQFDEVESLETKTCSAISVL